MDNIYVWCRKKIKELNVGNKINWIIGALITFGFITYLAIPLIFELVKFVTILWAILACLLTIFYIKELYKLSGYQNGKS